MSRKHFEALAREINEEYTTARGEDRDNDCALIAKLAGRIARVCSDHNPNFDDTRFLSACGITPTRAS